MNAAPIAGVLLAASLAGCAAFAPVDELTWSAELASTLPLEDGAQIDAGHFSRLAAGAADLGGWEPFAVLTGNLPTDYRLVELDGRVVLAAESSGGGSGMIRRLHFDPRRYPVIEFRWRVPSDSARGGANGPSRASPPVRISLAFDGDPAKLDFDDRAKLRMAKALTVNGLPYASLLYVWVNNHAADAIYSSPHTDRVRYVVVESGEQRAGQWITVRRNIVEDYRRAFGEEPRTVVAIGLMTDSGDNGAPRRAYYGDITLRPQ